MRSRRERMSAVDAAWLQMDTADNRMIITAVLDFDTQLESGQLERTLAALAAVPRFRQRVVPPLSPLSLPWWEDDPRFDLRAHLHHVSLPGTEEALRRFVGERMSAGLARDKPLWELDVVDRRRAGTALVLRVHHCVGDGVALTRLLLGLAEGQAEGPRPVGRPPEPRRAPIEWAKEQLSRAATAIELLLLPADPHTPLRGALGPVKTAAWTGGFPLQQVQEVARAQGATVNDVLMAALAGALRGLLEGGGALPAREIRALVPLYLRGREGSMGNQFGLVFVELPIGEADPGARLRKLKKRMDAVKSSRVAPVAFEILRLFGAAGAAAERLGVELFTRKATVMVTNVFGPQQRVKIAGRLLSSLMVWAPTSGFLGLGVTLLSYAGELRVGVSGDAHLLPEPRDLIRRLERELGLTRAGGEARSPAATGGTPRESGQSPAPA